MSGTDEKGKDQQEGQVSELAPRATSPSRSARATRWLASLTVSPARSRRAPRDPTPLPDDPPSPTSTPARRTRDLRVGYVVGSLTAIARLR